MNNIEYITKSVINNMINNVINNVKNNIKSHKMKLEINVNNIDPNKIKKYPDKLVEFSKNKNIKLPKNYFRKWSCIIYND